MVEVYLSLDPLDARPDVHEFTEVSDIPTRFLEIIPGLSVRRTPRDFVVLRLEDRAHPDRRDPDWKKLAKKKYKNERNWRREHELDWTTAAGDAFYPEYTFYGGHRVFVHPCTSLLRSEPIVRGWDFGQLHPAAVWFQRDPKTGRVWWLREVMPEQINVGAFADLVLYLSGQLDFQRLTPLTASWVVRIGNDPRYPAPPWFTNTSAIPLRFLDFAGPEANDTSDMPDEVSLARTRADVLASKGIFLSIHGGSVKGGTEILRELMSPLPDGLPGMLIDPACPLLATGFAGGFAFPKPTPGNLAPDAPHKDGYFEHVHDAARYGASGYVPLLLPRLLPTPPMQQTGRLLSPEEQESASYPGIPFNELDGV